jgi:hypothetical protein
MCQQTGEYLVAPGASDLRQIRFGGVPRQQLFGLGAHVCQRRLQGRMGLLEPITLLGHRTLGIPMRQALLVKMVERGDARLPL